MPKGPKGVKRPADFNAAAVMVGRIATGEIEDKSSKVPGRAAGGRAGGKARAEALSPKKRKEIAEKAAKSRWGNKKEY
jgi:hypothetical protein